MRQGEKSVEHEPITDAEWAYIAQHADKFDAGPEWGITDLYGVVHR